MFDIIPAIDLLDRQVVRLHKGNYTNPTVYSEDPPAFAQHFVEAGARRIHVVDLNAARNGERSANREILRSIVIAAGEVRVQTGGGIRSRSDIAEVLSLGVDRVILGTRAAKNPGEIAGWISEFGAERIVIGVDADGGRIRVQGWEEDGGFAMVDFLRVLEDAGVRLIVATNIAADGTLGGVDIAFYREIVEKSKLSVIVSGGVAGLDDVRRLVSWNHAQLSGMIVGKAYYEKKIDLRQAIDAAKG